MWPVTLTYFCYGWSLWLYMNWLPLFFKNNYSLDIRIRRYSPRAFFFAGVVGDSLGGILSDRILKKTGSVRFARLSVTITGFAGALLSLLPIPVHSRYHHRRLVLVGGLLLRRTRHRPDVVGADGHCAEIFRYRRWPDEYRLGIGRDLFVAVGGRLRDRCDR